MFKYQVEGSDLTFEVFPSLKTQETSGNIGVLDLVIDRVIRKQLTYSLRVLYYEGRLS